MTKNRFWLKSKWRTPVTPFKSKWKTPVTPFKNVTNCSSVDYALSAAYVKDALEGRFYKSGLGQNQKEKREIAIWCIYLTSHFAYTIFLLLVVGFHCALSALELPQMIAKSLTWKEFEPLAFWGGVGCCLFYLVDASLILFSCHPKQYLSFTHGRLYVLFVLLISLDYVLLPVCGRMIFRALRPILLIFRIPALRSTGLVMLGVTPKFLKFLLIFGGYVMIFSVVGVHLFMESYIDNEVVKRQHEGIYVGAFNHTGIALVEVFVLMAGGSYPRFMIPAYNDFGGLVLPFFVTIIITGEIVLYGILVAKIYDFYAKVNKKHVKQERHHERQCLIKAFEIVDEHNVGTVSFIHWKGLLKALRPNASSAEILKRFRKMKNLAKSMKPDDDKTGEPPAGDVYLSLDIYEFFYLPGVLQFTVEKSTLKRGFESATGNNVFSCLQNIFKAETIVRLCQRCYYSRWVYYSSLSINVLFLVPFVLFWFGISPLSTEIFFYLEASLLGIIVLEVIAQFIALGASYMFHELLLHILMVAVTCGCLIYSWATNLQNWNQGWISVTAYLCMVVRLSSFKSSSDKVMPCVARSEGHHDLKGKTSSTFHWFRRLAPPFFTLLLLTLIAFYTYGILGMECFGYIATIPEEHAVLPEGVSLCDYGFENIGCTFLTLFQISLGSSWHKVMHYIMEQISDWCCIYFVFFFAFMQMLLLNIISAIIVELANVISNDENEAKQRDKEFETKDENKTTEKLQEKSRVSMELFSNRSSSGNPLFLPVLSTTTGIFTHDCAFLSLPKRDDITITPETVASLIDAKEEIRVAPNACPANQRRPTLPCIMEEDLVLEDLDDVTLTGRKELGKWTRDILPNMTFLNAEDIKRYNAEMSASLAKKKLAQRKRPSSPLHQFQKSKLSGISA